jgi:membrane protease YdiL (CAAX protease family)
MQYKSNKGYSGFAQLGMIILFIGLGLILLGLLQMCIGILMIPKGTRSENLEFDLMKAMQDPKYINIIRIIQAIGTFCLMCLPALIYSWICNGKSMLWLGFSRHINVFQIILGFLIIFTANIAAVPLEELSRKIIAHFPSLNSMAHRLENIYNEQVVGLSNLKSWPEFFIAVIIMAFLPAMFEEMFFRGMLQNLFVKWWKMPIIAIIFTSLLFSLIHMSVYLFLSRAILGFALGLIYYKTKNIWVNIVAHFLNNLMAVSMLFWQSLHHQKIDLASTDPKPGWWGILAAYLALFFLFRILSRYSEKNKMKIYTREQMLLVKEPGGNPLV